MFERDYGRMKQITAMDQYNVCKAGKIHKEDRPNVPVIESTITHPLTTLFED